MTAAKFIGSLVDIGRAALLATAPAAPIVAATLVVAAYQADPGSLLFSWLEPWLLPGMVYLFLAWGLIAVIWAALGLTDVRRANAATYCELSNQMIEAQSMHAAVSSSTQCESSVAANRWCSGRANEYLDAMQNALEGKQWARSSWVLGTGYVSLWQMVHRAQEALISIEPLDALLQRAHYDQLRLANSNLHGHDVLSDQLRMAIDFLTSADPLAAQTAAKSPRPRSEQDARVVIGTIRQTLNEFRDENRAGLVRARNQLACTTLVTALIAYTVLWLAHAAGSSRELVAGGLEAAAAYFLIGALVGLFSRLHGELGADKAINDYGLSAMRLMAAPQLSGVAAVAGVGVLALAGMATGAGTGAAANIADAFKLPVPPANMLAAAAFGLTPGLLIDRLKQQTESLKGNLRGTEPQGASTTGPGAPTIIGPA